MLSSLKIDGLSPSPLPPSSLPPPPSLPLPSPSFLPPFFPPTLPPSLPPLPPSLRPLYRCMVIDSNAYVITHPKFFSEPESIENNHLSALEPFLIRDMYRMGYIGRVYCNNFQYNYQFTKRPRKQFSYEVTNMVHVIVYIRTCTCH